MSKIISLTTTNFKRAKFVEIVPDPDGNLVIVSGRNGQGKSSVLDSIAVALGGVSSKDTPRPIRDGEARAEIVLRTEDFVVTRTFTPSGSRLQVTSPDGAVYPAGQKKLDEYVAKNALDPLAFTNLSEKDQLAALLDLVELPFDLAELNAERKAVFEERTGVNRDEKTLAAQLASVPAPAAGLPAEEVSVSALLEQHRAGQELNNKISQARTDVEHWSAEVERLAEMAARAAKELERATEHLATAPAPVDLDAIQAQINTAEETNTAVRAAKQHQHLAQQVTEVQAKAAALTEKLNSIDKRKADGLAAATFPVDGLGFDETGVLFQGVPFKQASSAEQIRVSTAMAIALSPKLRIIRIADGSLLDADSLQLIHEQAKEADFQIWLEMVGPRDDAYVVEDGELI